MAGSSAEREIRDAVAAYARAEMPDARIIHELPMGGCRADLAAVTDTRIVAFEIKSKLDTLDRLERQSRSFAACAHHAILVADIKWFDREPYKDGGTRIAWPHDGTLNVWCWPDPPADISPYGLYRWKLPQDDMWQPHPRRFLETLIADELIAEARAAGVPLKSRDRCCDIRTKMIWHMTGEQIARAACRQLRMRRFPEADAAITSEAA